MQIVSRKPSDDTGQRMGRLAKLPLFFDLAGKRTIVAGGSDAAAWKAELLAAAGSHVTVYAAQPGRDMMALLARGAAGGSIALRACAWDEGSFAGAHMAIGDAHDLADLAAFCRVARQAGVLVNIIDRPDCSDFQFGSIVNRSPVVVGISTDGAAPMLGQAIRRRIETVLPLALSAWAALAANMRKSVMARLQTGSQRRTFWERFADKAFCRTAAEAIPQTVDTMMDAVANAVKAHAGHVTLVGAGPGDAELLTLKAVRALQTADIILYDDLISPDILELARREAKRMTVGKRGFRPSCAQPDINALMLHLARQGKRVVRLKSGDPMIFGRAGEEIELLQRHGIPVAVVPGITAALGMASEALISLTHRDHAQAVSFVTGHARTGALPQSIDWRAIAASSATTVFYMGSRKASAISAKLVEHGASADLPAVIMASISQPGQRLWKGTVAGLAEGVAHLDSQGPILIAVGAALAAGCSKDRAGTAIQRHARNDVALHA